VKRYISISSSLGDLFPALDVPRKRDLDFEGMIKTAAIDLKLQADDGFVLKVRYAHIISFCIILISKCCQQI